MTLDCDLKLHYDGLLWRRRGVVNQTFHKMLSIMILHWKWERVISCSCLECVCICELFGRQISFNVVEAGSSYSCVVHTHKSCRQNMCEKHIQGKNCTWYYHAFLVCKIIRSQPVESHIYCNTAQQPQPPSLLAPETRRPFYHDLFSSYDHLQTM